MIKNNLSISGTQIMGQIYFTNDLAWDYDSRLRANPVMQLNFAL